MKRINQNNYYQKLAKKLAFRICYKEKLLPLKIEVKDLKGSGRTRYFSRYISIPFWTTINKYYFVYYVLHELTHLILLCGHNIKFKNKEADLLKQYNIGIIYNRAYPKYLYNYKTKEIICNGLGEKNKGENICRSIN